MNVPKLRFIGYNDQWKNEKLGILCNIKKGNGLSKSDLTEDGKECILYGELYTKYNEVIETIYSKTNKISSTFILSKKNTVIIPASGETPLDIVKASCVMKDNIILGGDLNVLEPYNLDGRFLSYEINSKRKLALANLSQGHSVVHLYGEKFKNVNIAYPSNEEQTKIANTLQLLDKKIELQSRKIEALKLYKKGLLKDEYSRICKINLTELKKIADVYQPTTISSSQCNNGYYEVFGANGIIGKYTEYNHEMEQVTVSCRGENSGKINITPKQCWINGNSMVVNVDNSKIINKSYLKYILESQNLKYLVSGSGQPQIIRADIIKHKIPLISVEEQISYSIKFEKIDKKIDLNVLYLNTIIQLKKGLMQSMFV